MPMNMPVWVSRVASTAWAMPKSIRTGSPSRISTLPGLRSRWITPTECTAASAVATPCAILTSAGRSSGPSFLTISSSGRPGHVTRDDVRAMTGHIGVEHLGDVFAAHPAHGLDLAREPPPGDLVAGDLGAQDLDRHLPSLRVDSEVDNAHSAFTEPPEQPVRAESVIVHGMKHHTGLIPAHEMNHGPHSHSYNVQTGPIGFPINGLELASVAPSVITSALFSQASAAPESGEFGAAHARCRSPPRVLGDRLVDQDRPVRRAGRPG